MAPTEHSTKETIAAWEMQFRRTEIEFACHDDGAVYLSLNWNGVTAWEYVGQAGTKSFPNWLRKVADKMEKKL